MYTHIYIYIYIEREREKYRQEYKFVYIFITNTSARAGCDTRSILSLTGLSSEFSFFYTNSHTKVKEPSLSDYLLIAGRRIVGLKLFPRILALCEMQIALFIIWTRVTVSISNNKNHYTMGTSIEFLCCYLCKYKRCFSTLGFLIGL